MVASGFGHAADRLVRGEPVLGVTRRVLAADGAKLMSEVMHAMLHHISFAVADLERSAEFYDAALQALGYARVWSDVRPGEENQAIGYGRPGNGDSFAIKHAPGMQCAPGPGFHLAFAAPSRQAVDDFHRKALAAGGRDNGGPGLRLRYGPNYYAAFVLDPDGYRIEAVFDDPI